MTIAAIMQHPAIKAEGIDLGYLPPSYYQQQQQQLQQQQLQQQQRLQQQQQQQRMAPQTHSHLAQQTAKTTCASVHVKPTEHNLENQPDFQSIKGVFGWTVVDLVNIPYILRSDKQFVSVRIVEMKLLSRYPNSYPDDLGKQAPLTSFFITSNEAKLLNEINLQHCAGEYGKKEFSMKDLIVLLTDFIHFYNLVKKTFPDAAVARQQATETAGWLQIKNTVTPYINRMENKYVPLSVIQYAAGLLTNEKVSGLPPSKRECDMLNEACKTAGVEFVFSDSTTRLINVKDILKISAIDIIELPSSNPLKHATYMELPTTSNSRPADKPKSSPSPSQNNQRQAQPYLFQPGAQLDTNHTQIQGNMTRPENNGSRFPLMPHSGFPNNQMMNTRMMDPRMAEMYRMQYGAPTRPIVSNGPPNVRLGQLPYNQLLPQVNPMMQYYLNFQNNLNIRNQSPGLQSNKEMTQQRPMSNGTESSPISQSRPSSGSRPPSGSPLGSPLSPTGHSFPQMTPRTGVGFPSNIDVMAAAVAGQVPSINGGLAIQQMQTMCGQRFPNPGVMPTTAREPNMSTNSQSKTFTHPGMGGHSHQDQVQKRVVMSSPNQQPSPQGPCILPHSANQEIPGLFSPTGSSVAPPNSRTSTHVTTEQTVPPPPLQLMPSPSSAPSDKPVSQILTSPNHNESPIVPVTHDSDRVVPVSTHIGPPMPAPRNQPLPTTISAAKPPVSLVNCIKGAWLNNKSISCLYLEDQDRTGPFCLVEAVCKLYFNGCSVNEFLFALENVLSVPLLTCDVQEEKAFIQYYSLPVVTLKCNKMIKFDDLEKYFPQLTYMFPSKEAIAQSEGEVDELGVTDTSDVAIPNGALTAEDIEASMPTTVCQMNAVGEKRHGDPLLNGNPPKHQRLGCADDEDDAIIILD